MNTSRSGRHPKIRTFIACKIPEDILKAVQTVQAQLKIFDLKHIRWTRPEGIHLTLKFLGDIPLDDVVSVGEAMVKAAGDQAPVSIAARGIGVFPGYNRPRVLWIGLSGQMHELSGIQQRLDTALIKIGFPGETRPFRGHLTIGRIRGPVDSHRFHQALRAAEHFESRTFTIKNIIFFQSELHPDGAIYTQLKTVPLAG